MHENPISIPHGDSKTLEIFLRHFGVSREIPRRQLLSEVSGAFARIPYENLTKIISFAATGTAQRARRGPEEVVSEHLSWGAGGTCFSLTAAFLHLLRGLGFRAEPILADRRYGADTHCAMLVWLDDRPHLLDPGYLIVRPIDLDAGEQRIATTFNEILLVPEASGERIELHTIQQGNRTYRLTFKTSPAQDGEFLRAWDASFDWEMMEYPVLTRIAGDRQFYLQDRQFHARRLDGVDRKEVSSTEVVKLISADFGIGSEIASRALRILKRRGHGSTAAR